MSAMTPLGIVYPCGGDTIDCTVFETNANSIQQALEDAQDVVDSVLHPPAVWVRRGAGEAASPGVTLVLSYVDVMYDTAAMFNPGTPTLITVTSPGTYLVNLESSLFTFPTTLTSYRAAILVNGTEVAYYKSDAGTSTNLASQPMYVSAMPISMIPGDVITTTFLYTGTGGMTVIHFLSVMRISTT